MTVLVAGRELDTQIVEKVMGWDRGVDAYGQPVWYRASDGVPVWPDRGCFHFPRVSTDATDALTILDHLGGRVVLTRGLNEWTASIGDVTCWGETLPLAICRAALTAVERVP